MGNGNTALHTAARLGAAEIVEQLLFFGTPLALNQTRESPLMLGALPVLPRQCAG